MSAMTDSSLSGEAVKTHTLNDQGSARTDEHSARTSTTSRASRASSVNGNVTADNEGIAAVPAAALDPVDGVEEGRRAAVAGILGVDALDVVVASLLKEVHEDGLGSFGLVDDGLCANFKAANSARVNVVLLEEVRGNCKNWKSKQAWK